MYGITETTVHVTYYPLSRLDAERPSLSLIGTPIPDLQVYVLDRQLGLCPIGVPGEIHVAGGGVARGYLRRPELTAERFIPNPFGAGRLYRSGDLGRYRADGRMEYLGRIDHQVKVRGHRIELGEIETTLSRHPAVRENAVVCREDAEGDRRLIAYIVRGETFPSASEMRSFLKRTLPDYMVPSGFVFLDALPLTPNGKVDRDVLPALEQTRPGLEAVFEPPRNLVEQTVAGLWAQILGLEKVGVHDNFFELGGHSLLATQVISRVRDSFDVELPLRALFEFPTLAALARVVEEATRIKAQPEGPGPVPLSRNPRPIRVTAQGSLKVSE